MLDTLTILVRFDLITQEQADAYWDEVTAERERMNQFVDNWLSHWRAQTPWWRRAWVWFLDGGPERMIREAWWEQEERSA